MPKIGCVLWLWPFCAVVFFLLGNNGALAAAGAADSNFIIYGFDMQQALCELERRSYNFYGACDTTATTETTTTETTKSFTTKKTGESTPIDPKTCWIIVGLGTLSAVVSAVFLVIIWWICCKGKNKKKASPSKKESGSKKNANDKAEQKYPGHAEKDPAVSPYDAPNETEDSEQMEMGILEEKQQHKASAKDGETDGAENSAGVLERAPAMAAANLDNGAVRTNAVSDYVTITILTAQPSPTETVEDGNND